MAARREIRPVTIRGISTTTRIDQGQGTTGYFLDDVPLTDPFFSMAIPDIDAFDVNNVSVLRGPQGTLFGSASLGGAINYQTAKPDASRWDARVQGSYAGVTDGGNSQSGKVMINAPIVSDKLAVRGVYVYRDDAGFIDNVGTGRRGCRSRAGSRRPGTGTVDADRSNQGQLSVPESNPRERRCGVPGAADGRAPAKEHRGAGAGRVRNHHSQLAHRSGIQLRYVDGVRGSSREALGFGGRCDRRSASRCCRA